ncbi:rhomboid family intramembrane serine protease [Halorarius litoreus]|uniref:rhomboid family intramembrane serine protease n=1 Tax=Halorarius litoreus TaxID=2962676 RepID=UPI0020CB98CE|nr:rhomboid family intramembrane serine protease [Halorarius litoreus]
MLVPDWVYRLLIVLTGLLSVAVVVALARPAGGWGHRLRRRFVMGVPWGTLLTIGVVIAFYAFVQGAVDGWRNPLVIPFRAWSYFYPTGILTAGLAHAGEGHLVGNLLGTLVFGSLAEYAWGHFPSRRGSQSFRSLPENPFARIAVFPLACVAAAVLSGVFGLGPVIGFSGVVFAFAGFSVVRYPIATVILLVGSDLVTLVYRALQTPVLPGSAGPAFTTPWWANVAIQGHAVGFFMGLVAGVLLFRRRGSVAPAGRVWFGALAFAAAKGLWAVYLIRGGGQFTLFRAGGVALLFVLAALVVSAARASDRDLVGAIDLSRREAAVGLLVTVLFALALVAVPYNLLTIEDASVDANVTSIEARDYTVLYAEGTPDRYVGAYDLPIVNTSGVTSSGVIVASEERGIWWEAVSKGRLAFSGRQVVRVGGIGWEERVVANRSGWNTVGGPTAYKVYLKKGGPENDRQLAYLSPPAPAEPTIDGRNVSVAPTAGGFELVIARGNETLGRSPLPGVNETRTAGGLTFVRNETRLFATANDTRVRVATQETYN